MPPPRVAGTTLRFLVAALLLGAVATAVRSRGDGPERVGFVPAGHARTCEPVSACGPQLVDDMPGAPEVSYEDACRDGAYLCDGLALRRPPLRAFRWNDARSAVRIEVPYPPNLDRAVASRHQQGAVRGLRAWESWSPPVIVDAERPPPPRATLRDRPTPSGVPVVRQAPRARVQTRADGTRSYASPYENDRPDVKVDWSVVPGTSEMGESYTRWGSDGVRGGYGTEITAIRLPMAREARGVPLSDREVEAAAAHAMGHALGLPHSAGSDDVMYPGNTARTPSADDIRALRALYALPNGALIRR